MELLTHEVYRCLLTARDCGLKLDWIVQVKVSPRRNRGIGLASPVSAVFDGRFEGFGGDSNGRRKTLSGPDQTVDQPFESAAKYSQVVSDAKFAKSDECPKSSVIRRSGLLCRRKVGECKVNPERQLAERFPYVRSHGIRSVCLAARSH